MAGVNTQDLIVDGAELSYPITIKRGKTTRTYQVIAYPTQLTRKTTNLYADGTVKPDPKAVKKCRWHTAGIVRFHVNPETNAIYDARPDMHELEITLECLLDDSHKQMLAQRAEEIYGLEFSTDNFVICPFQTFIGQLVINIGGEMKTFFGTLVDNTELHPMRIIFEIKDRNELSAISTKLDSPRDHDIILRYEYSLSGTSTARASLTVSAEELAKIDLEKQIFGSSKAESMVVSRSFMDKITGSIVAKLKVVEDIGVGGSSFGQDIIKQELAHALSVTGFEKFNIDDLKKLEAGDTEITDDLKSNIISSASTSNSGSSTSAHYNLDKETSAKSSDILLEESAATHRAGGQSSSSSQSDSYKGGVDLGYGGFKLGLTGEKSSSSSHSASSNFDNADASSSKDHKKLSQASSQHKENADRSSQSNAAANKVEGNIRLVKNIEAAIIHRHQISKGFTISLERYHHQIASASIKGRLTTKTDADILDESQLEKAKNEALLRELELTPQQIDDILHEVDSLDEEQLQEMHEEFLKLCPDGAMSKEVFSKAFQKQYPKGKASSYCRYAYDVFDRDKSGKLNFTEYVLAMHIHKSDDMEQSLALAFDIFDYDKSGEIDQKEILRMITSTGELIGQPVDLTNAKNLAKKILDSCDKQRNKKITKQEFLDGCKSVKEYCQVLIPNFDNATPIDPNYEGEWQNGDKHGKGIYNWADGRRYEGQWKDDKQHGKGILTSPDGGKYEGDWEGGLKNGKGVEILPDGSRYEGQWVDDKKNGKGVWNSSDGEKYQGDFKDDEKDGKGVWISVKGDRYEGEFKDNKKNGKGVWHSVDDEDYEGEYEDDKKNGKGSWKNKNGDAYTGDFKDDMKHGTGVWTSKDGTKYEGQFKNNGKNGKGVLTMVSGDRYEGEFEEGKDFTKGVLISKAGDRYEGKFKNFKKHGQGVLVWANGNRYNGEFTDDTMNGRAVWTSTDGARYEGQYKDGKKHGKGTHTWNDGDQYEGDWQFGDRTGHGVFKWTDGDRYEGSFVTGDRTGQGTFYYSDGSRYVGEWLKGKKNGKGRTTQANGSWVEGYYVDGKLQGCVPTQTTYYYYN